ncbi:hypothetical protein ACI2LF_18245 [Kribbella sp. NPDC020789]
MSKFLGFLLGVAVALAGPAVFGVLGAPGGLQLNTKEMALAYGVGALLFWAIVSYFSGAAAIGAFLAFGTLVYCWLWIPNRTTNFLDDVPGITNGMVDGSRQYTLNGVVPILTVISLIYAIQLIVRSVQRRRRARAEAERLQREQEAAQAEQEAAAAAVYPVAASTYPAESYAAPSYEPSNRYDDLFDEEPQRPRSQADEQTAQFPVAESAPERTAAFSPFEDEEVADGNDDTVLVPSDRDETVVAPIPDADEPTVVAPQNDETVVADKPDAEETREVAESAPEETAPDNEAATPEPEKPAAASPAAQAPVAAAPVASTPPVAAAPAASEPPAAPADPGADATPAATPTTPPATTSEAAPDDSKDDDDPKEPPASGPTNTAVAAPAEKPVQRDSGWQSAEAFTPAVSAPERVGQQYRERMENPEDTGEFHVSAFEGPFNTPGVRPAGA